MCLTEGPHPCPHRHDEIVMGRAEGAVRLTQRLWPIVYSHRLGHPGQAAETGTAEITTKAWAVGPSSVMVRSMRAS